MFLRHGVDIYRSLYGGKKNKYVPNPIPHDCIYYNGEPVMQGNEYVVYYPKINYPENVIMATQTDTVIHNGKWLVYSAVEDPPENVLMYEGEAVAQQNKFVVYSAVEDPPENVVEYTQEV